MPGRIETFCLTNAQWQQFDRDGYLVVEDLFTDADLQPVIEEISAEIDERARALVEAGELSDSHSEADFEHRLALISNETDKIALAIWNGALAGPAIFNLIRHPKLLDLAEQILGDELIASSVYRLRPKVPGHRNGPVPWHQDSGYFEPFCDTHLVLTVWLPLVDATEERGCMWVVPGAHNGPVMRHRQREGKAYLEIPEEELPPTEPICVPVRKGGALLLTNLAPHASFENMSEVVRWSMDLRYQSAALPTNATISRLDGELSGSPEEGIPIACYPPEADFLVRSRLRPTEVVTDPAVFKAIRANHPPHRVTTRW